MSTLTRRPLAALFVLLALARCGGDGPSTHPGAGRMYIDPSTAGGDSASPGDSDTGAAHPGDSHPAGDVTSGDAGGGDNDGAGGDTQLPVSTGCATPNPGMTFFVTDQGSGQRGANLGGLAGADAWCESAASAVGAGGKGWRAYLSADNNGSPIHARERIGNGPWFNFDGRAIGDLQSIHDGNTGVAGADILTECGRRILWAQGPWDDYLAGGPLAEDIAHDVMTGSDPDGYLYVDYLPPNWDAVPLTCADWTNNSDPVLYTIVGHTEGGPGEWSSTHSSSPVGEWVGPDFIVSASACSAEGLETTAANGRIYCFATN